MSPVTTIIIPVSRRRYLDSIFARLEMMDCDRETTNLLVIVDGDPSLYAYTRNQVEMSKFSQRLCIQFTSKHKLRKFDVLGRRMRISDIHNEIKKHITKNTDFILGLEDDTIFPSNTLRKLHKLYSIYPHAGMIQGVELGRWGITMVGAWKIDNLYDPTEFSSMLPPEKIQQDSIEEMDAGGLFCFLTKADNYLSHEFKPFDNVSMGPDFDWGISLRQLGMMNYIDWSLQLVHKTNRGDLSLSKTPVEKVTFRKKNRKWRQNRE